MLAICVESSHARGMGHLYRSMNLACDLVSRGHQVRFFINDHPVSQKILASRGFEFDTVCLTDLDSNWESVCVRQYGIGLWLNDRLDTDRRHSLHIISENIPLVTLDDRGSGAIEADLNIVPLAFKDCYQLKGKRVLHGVEYLILNPEISVHRRVRDIPEPLLVTLGGSDTWGVTVQVVDALAKRNRAATVILGPGFEHEIALSKVLTDKFEVKRGVPSLIEEMSRHGLAITGGGITPFEANAAGLPCIVIASEWFEVPVGQALAELGGSVFAGHYSEMDSTVFDRFLPVEEMSRAGISRIGLNGTQNVVQHLEELLAA